MSFSGYMKDMGIDLWKMFYANRTGVSMQESLLGNIKVSNLDLDASGTISGNASANVSDSRYREYMWMQGNLALSGTEDQANNTFEMQAALETFSVKLKNATFKVDTGKLNLYNRKPKISNATNGLSGFSVQLDGSLQIAGASYKARLSFVPFQNDDITELTLEFTGTDKKANCLSLLAGLSGALTDISSQFPPWITYQDVMELESMTFWVTAESLKKSTETSGGKVIECKFASQASFAVELAVRMSKLPITSDWFKLDKLSINLSCNLNQREIRLNQILGSMSLLDIPIAVQSSTPFFHMEISMDELEEKPIAELLGKFSLTTPAFLSSTVLKQVYLDIDLDSYGYYASIRLGEPGASDQTCLLQQACPNAGNDSGIKLLDASLAIDNLGERTTVTAGISLIVVKDKELGCQFMLGGEWTDSTLHLTGRLVQLHLSLLDLYASFFGTQIAAKLPNITIKNLAVGVKIGDGVTVESLEGSVAVSVNDTDVIGQSFEIAHADVCCDKDSFEISGSFSFGKYFQVNAKYSRSGTKMQWKFLLIMGKLQLEISYDKTSNTVKGTIDNEYTLGDMLDFLLGLLNPSESFGRTGAWAFLNDISIKNAQIAYRMDTSELSLKITPSIKLSFITMSTLVVIMNDTGVKLQVQGDFMDKTYDEKNPLAFAPNDPPSVEGRGIAVDYLLLGTGLEAKGLTGKDVSGDMQKLQKLFSKDTKISDLKIDSKAGSRFALETTIADMVRLKLLYLEDYTYCGGYFELYGDNASSLKGLSASLSYSRANGSLGVFSGKFTPPAALRQIKLGTMTFSVGSIQADIYSNGDFFLDLGYPQNKDFGRSFAFQYGAFSGSGGAYLQKATDACTDQLPILTSGYYSNVLGLGIGMRLRLGYNYQGGIFKARAELVMQGCFEGLYARKQTGSSGSDYYSLSADVVFTGLLQGKVDFGIIGAAVDIMIQAAMNLTLTSGKALEADVSFKVKAQASVKVWFARVHFSFSLESKLHFNFGRNNDMLLSGTSYPRGLISLQANDAAQNDPVQIECALMPVATRYNQSPSAAVMLMLKTDQFDRLLDKLIQVLDASNALDTDSLELFAGCRIGDEQAEIYQILQDNFVFKIGEPSGTTTETDVVLMPLPDQVTLVMERYYNNGNSDATVRKLSDYEIMDEAYKKKVEEYYSDTSSNGIGDDRDSGSSVQSYLFTDFFEMIFKAVRAQKETSLNRNETFDAHCLGDEQKDNIRAVVNRFTLGGRRAPKKSGIAGVTGIPRIAGSQIEFVMNDRITKYAFKLQQGETMPAWLQFAEGKDELAVTWQPDVMSEQLPARQFSTDLFVQEPSILPAYRMVTGDSIYPALSFSTPKYDYYELGNNMTMGKRYTSSADWGYAGMFSLVLEKADDSAAVYRITDYRDTKQLEQWISKFSTVTETAYMFQDGDHYREFSPKDKDIVCLKNIAAGTESFQGCCAAMSEGENMLEMLRESCDNNGEYYLYFPEDMSLPESNAFEMWFVFRFANDTECSQWHNAFYAKDGDFSLTQDDGRLQQFTEQGTVQVQVHISEKGLTEEEKRLRQLYSGLAAELAGSDGTVLTNETPSYFGEYDDNGVTYTLPFPYARALTHDASQIYHGIAEQEHYIIKLFWTDILGNRLETSKTVTVFPKYHDRLMGLDEFPSLGLTASVYAGGIRLAWKAEAGHAFDTSEQERIRYGYNQIKAEDVRMQLSGEWLSSDITLDKSKFTDFLSSLLDGNDSAQSLEYDVETTISGANMQILSAEIFIKISRDETLCESYKGIDIQQSTTSLRLKSSSDSQIKMLSGAGCGYLLTEAQSPLANIAENYYFRIAPLPTVSGTFTGKDGAQVQLTGRNLDEILDQFLADFRQLLTPQTLCCFYQDEALRKQIAKLNSIYEDTAGALAASVKQLCQYPDKATDPDRLESYAKSFFRKHLMAVRKDMLFVQTKINLAVQAAPLRLQGIVGDALSFPTSVSFSTQQSDCFFAVETNETYASKGREFQARYVYDETRKIQITPDDPSDDIYKIAFGTDDKIAPGLSEPPSSPGIMSVYRSDSAAEFSMGIAMAVEDCLLVEFGQTQNMQSINSEWPVYAMEQYRLKSREYLSAADKDGYMNLIDLMSHYVEALQKLACTTKEACGHQFTLKEKGDSGYKKLGCSIKDDALSVSVSLDNETWHEMSWSSDGYRADGVELPADKKFYLKLKKADAQDKAIGLQLKRTRNFVEGSSYAASPEHILCSPQVIF